MRTLIFALTTFLLAATFNVEAQESNALKNKATSFGDNAFEGNINKLSSSPGDLYLRTASGKYIQINDKNYAVTTDNVAQATVFGLMVYQSKKYYIANSGTDAGYYLSYANNGYMGVYGWTNSVAWTQDASLCLTVDNGKSWKTYEYETGGLKYVVIGDYSYTQQCFLPVPASDAYKTVSLQGKYINENASCTWQLTGQCAPYVTYYSDSQTATLALRVAQGKLYQGNALFDTTGADPSHSIAHTSIVVMDPNGRIYASKQNKIFLFHHSSLLAGRDVAFAGELQVVQGVIQNVTNCSGHYMPPNALSQQFVDSLNKQGYSGAVTVKPCVPILMDLNYSVLALKHKSGKAVDKSTKK